METPECVAIDLPCVNCGYNLRTQPEEAVYPECATAVRVSREQSPYAWEPERVGRVASGVGFLLVAQAVGLGAIGLTLVALFLPDRGGGLGALMLFGITQLVAAAFLALAAWRLPPMHTSARGEGHILRRVLSATGAGTWFMTLVCLGFLQRYNGTEEAARAFAFFSGASFFVWGRYQWSLARPLSTVSARCDWRNLGKILRGLHCLQGLALALLGSYLMLLTVFDKFVVLFENAGPAAYPALALVYITYLLASLAMPVTLLALIITLAQLWAKLRSLLTPPPEAISTDPVDGPPPLP